jgi:hypothetical protein
MGRQIVAQSVRAGYRDPYFRSPNGATHSPPRPGIILHLGPAWRVYRGAKFDSDRERVEFLFQLYEKLATHLTAGTDKKRRKKADLT